MTKKVSEVNRNYVFEEKFLSGSVNESLRFTEELIELNRIGARFVVTIGNRFIVLHVFCRTNHSKAYRLCEEFMYTEI